MSRQAQAAAPKSKDNQGGSSTDNGAQGKGGNSAPTGPAGKKISEADQRLLDKLKATDARVRTHEEAHMAAGGSLVRGGPNYQYQKGPDGKAYAVGGEVSVDTSPVSGDPAATIRKAEQIKRAALAPADPSGQDRSVASEADAMEANARAEELQKPKSRNPK